MEYSGALFVPSPIFHARGRGGASVAALAAELETAHLRPTHSKSYYQTTDRNPSTQLPLPPATTAQANQITLKYRASPTPIVRDRLFSVLLLQYNPNRPVRVSPWAQPILCYRPGSPLYPTTGFSARVNCPSGLTPIQSNLSSESQCRGVWESASVSKCKASTWDATSPPTSKASSHSTRHPAKGTPSAPEPEN